MIVSYLDAVGENRSCLEAKPPAVVVTVQVQVRNSFDLAPRRTKKTIEPALARIQLIYNADIEWVTDPDTGDLISELSLIHI